LFLAPKLILAGRLCCSLLWPTETWTRFPLLLLPSSQELDIDPQLLVESRTRPLPKLQTLLCQSSPRQQAYSVCDLQRLAVLLSVVTMFISGVYNESKNLQAHLRLKQQRWTSLRVAFERRRIKMGKTRKTNRNERVAFSYPFEQPVELQLDLHTVQQCAAKQHCQSKQTVLEWENYGSSLFCCKSLQQRKASEKKGLRTEKGYIKSNRRLAFVPAPSWRPRRPGGRPLDRPGHRRAKLRRRAARTRRSGGDGRGTEPLGPDRRPRLSREARERALPVRFRRMLLTQ